MKFGKYLAKRHLDLPEYANYFMNYKALKKLIKRLAAPDPQSRPGSAEVSRQEAHKRLQESKATFFFQLERELEKVQNFYQQKESELVTRLEVLEQKKRTAAQSGNLSRNSVTFISLYEGLQRFRRDLERLEQFIELNGTAFSKVLKKWDKRSRSHLKELYLTRAVEMQPMFHRETLAELSDRVNRDAMELEALAQGSDGVQVFEQSSRTAAAAQHDDLHREFIKFAQSYTADEPESERTMQEWIAQLTNSAEAAREISSTFLMAVSSKAKDEVLLALIDTGYVDFSQVDEIGGRNCLHLAAFTQGRTQLVKTALQHQVRADVKDFYGRTPLHYASIYGRQNFIGPFIDAGAEIDLLDNDNYSALHYSIFHKFTQITQDLVNRGAKLDGDSERNYIPLNFACQHGAIDAVRVLLAQRRNFPMVPDAEGLYPLHVVARAGLPDIVPLLVQAGANINQLDKLNGWTALMYAASEGFTECVRSLLGADADWRILDEKGRSALFYACYEGRSPAMKLLSQQLPKGTVDISYSQNPLPVSNAHAKDINDDNLTDNLDDMDLTEESGLDLDIPDLSLPPPIVPLQRYGHNFLDSHKTVVQLTFSPASSATGQTPTKFREDRKFLSVGRMVVASSGTKDSIPRNISLPIQDIETVHTFQVESLFKFALDFELYPTFGTQLLAKASALPSTFTSNEKYPRQARVSMTDPFLRTVGELEFNFLVVKPYAGQALDVAHYETYWKSTSYVGSESTLAIVTGSSISGVYENTVVVLTRDAIPVILDTHIECQGVRLSVPSLNLEELERLHGHVVTLEELLAGDSDKQLDLLIPYPTRLETKFSSTRWRTINEYADKILDVVFSYVRESRKRKQKPRSLIFSSPNPDMCAVVNWKQPNYPVLFRVQGLRTDGMFTSANAMVVSETWLDELRVCVSIKEAAHFAATNNLMGVIFPADVLKLVPALIPATRLLGLILVATSQRNVQIEGCDGVETGTTLVFPPNKHIQ